MTCNYEPGPATLAQATETPEWAPMTRKWMNVGREYWDGDTPKVETGRKCAKQLIERAVSELEWIDATVDQDLPIMPGLAIKEVVKEFRIPRVTLFSHNCRELAPYGFYGIEGNYKNGRVRLYLIDSGTACTPVCADHWPK